MAATVSSTHTDIAGLRRPDGALDASLALREYGGPWNERLAAHLLRRAGFGGTPTEIARLSAMGTAHDAVESLVHFPPTSALPPPSDLYDPQPVIFQEFGMGRRRLLSDPQRREIRRGIAKQEHRSIRSLQRWWLDRMLATPAPLQEKMAFYFHGHFTTAAIQKGVTPPMIFNQNQLFRRYALGNLRDLAWNVSIDPAMLIYLDNASNDAAHPNENYAREFMELFTLGVDRYSEEDVRQAARAWTGWKVNRREEKAYFNVRVHDGGVKTFLGQTGSFDGRDVVRIIFGTPQCAAFFAGSLLNYFVYNNPEPQLVSAVANLIRRNDYELAPVMSALLRSNVFFSSRAYRGLVKSPVEFVVGTYKALNVPQTDPRALRALVQMGQVLFHPPNVAGWPGGENWITSQTLIARENFVAGLVNSPLVTQDSWIGTIPMKAMPAAQSLAYTILRGDASPKAVAQIADYLDGAETSALGTLSAENYPQRVRGAAYLTMATPAYQLN